MKDPLGLNPGVYGTRSLWWRSRHHSSETVHCGQLFVLAAILLGIDLAIPDIIPFLDEALLALLTAMLAMLRRRDPQPDPGPPGQIEKNVTPR